MGLLDDAIREHLDLKRRHGASDDEIAQKEAEALGPARREFPRPAEEDVPMDDTTADVDEESVATIGDPFAEEIAEPPVFDLPSEPEASAVEPDVPVEPAPAPRAELADTEEYRFEDEEDEEDDDDAYGDDDDDVLDDDDDFSDLDDDDDEDDEDDDEDLLGDTPDFLQDTPEHDRLWFEQKPPRDFDFE
jgi:hypothetical protein